MRAFLIFSLLMATLTGAWAQNNAGTPNSQNTISTNGTPNPSSSPGGVNETDRATGLVVAARVYKGGGSFQVMAPGAGGCKAVRNNHTYDVFIPTKTLTEWNKFESHPPTNVTISACGSTPPACGADHGQNLSSAPTQLCATGNTASAVTTTSTNYAWTCTSGAGVASCSATVAGAGVWCIKHTLISFVSTCSASDPELYDDQTAYATQAACESAAGISTPGGVLCAASGGGGSTTIAGVNFNLNLLPTQYAGTSCVQRTGSACKVLQVPTCGTANGASTSSAPATGLCSAGSAVLPVFDDVPNSKYTWSCQSSTHSFLLSYCQAPKVAASPTPAPSCIANGDIVAANGASNLPNNLRQNGDPAITPVYADSTCCSGKAKCVANVIGEPYQCQCTLGGGSGSTCPAGSTTSGYGGATSTTGCACANSGEVWNGTSCVTPFNNCRDFGIEASCLTDGQQITQGADCCCPAGGTGGYAKATYTCHSNGAGNFTTTMSCLPVGGVNGPAAVTCTSN